MKLKDPVINFNLQFANRDELYRFMWLISPKVDNDDFYDKEEYEIEELRTSLLDKLNNFR